jgi:hypothetical protein
MLIEEYFSAVRAALQVQLVYNFQNVAQGKDTSDILRGKIMILDDLLGMKKMFEKFDELDKKVKEEEEKRKNKD